MVRKILPLLSIGIIVVCSFLLYEDFHSQKEITPIQITDYSNDTYALLHDQQDLTPIKTKHILSEGDILAAGKNGVITVKIGERDSMRFLKHSLVKFQKISRKKIELLVYNGAVLSGSPDLRTQIQINSPVANIVGAHSIFLFNFSSKIKEAKMMVFDGDVVVQKNSPADLAVISSGHGVVINNETYLKEDDSYPWMNSIKWDKLSVGTGFEEYVKARMKARQTLHKGAQTIVAGVEVAAEKTSQKALEVAQQIKEEWEKGPEEEKEIKKMKVISDLEKIQKDVERSNQFLKMIMMEN